jgi:hypothetical protein
VDFVSSMCVLKRAVCFLSSPSSCFVDSTHSGSWGQANVRDVDACRIEVAVGAFHFAATKLAEEIIVQVSSSAKEEHNPAHCVSVVL